MESADGHGSETRSHVRTLKLPKLETSKFANWQLECYRTMCASDIEYGQIVAGTWMDPGNKPPTADHWKTLQAWAAQVEKLPLGETRVWTQIIGIRVLHDGQRLDDDAEPPLSPKMSTPHVPTPPPAKRSLRADLSAVAGAPGAAVETKGGDLHVPLHVSGADSKSTRISVSNNSHNSDGTLFAISRLVHLDLQPEL